MRVVGVGVHVAAVLADGGRGRGGRHLQPGRRLLPAASAVSPAGAVRREPEVARVLKDFKQPVLAAI
jgi:uncharacterized protein involved in response to NO